MNEEQLEAYQVTIRRVIGDLRQLSGMKKEQQLTSVLILPSEKCAVFYTQDASTITAFLAFLNTGGNPLNKITGPFPPDE